MTLAMYILIGVILVAAVYLHRPLCVRKKALKSTDPGREQSPRRCKCDLPEESVPARF